MSGGSFNYLCDAAGMGRLGERRAEVARMVMALGDYDHPGVAHAAANTRQVLVLLEQADELAVRLTDVWQAVEWHYSSDCTTGQVHEALAKYATPPGEVPHA